MGRMRKPVPHSDDEFVTAPEVAGRLRVSVDWVYERAKSGDLPSYKLPGGRRIFVGGRKWWRRSRSAFGRVGRCPSLGRRSDGVDPSVPDEEGGSFATTCVWRDRAGKQRSRGFLRRRMRSGSESSRIGPVSSGSCTSRLRSGLATSWRRGFVAMSSEFGRQPSSGRRSRSARFHVLSRYYVAEITAARVEEIVWQAGRARRRLRCG